MRKITIEMACSINGIIATEDGNEDFLLYRGWEIMLDFLKEYDVLVWGRKTWENIISWGDKYINDLKNINIIILTTNKELKEDNVKYCASIDECLELCEKLNYEKIFVSGGATINNEFMKRKIVDNIILNYNPYVLNKGIPLFTGDFFESKLKLDKVVREAEDIVQIHYNIVENKEKKIRNAAKCYLIKNDEVLAIKYNTDNIKAGYYDIPGGKIENDENAELAAIRELKEETGVTAKNLKYKGKMRVEYPDRIYIFDVFLSNEFEGILNPVENNTAEWIKIEELLKKPQTLSNIALLENTFIKGLICEKYNFEMYIKVDEDENILKIDYDLLNV